MNFAALKSLNESANRDSYAAMHIVSMMHELLTQNVPSRKKMTDIFWLLLSLSSIISDNNSLVSNRAESYTSQNEPLWSKPAGPLLASLRHHMIKLR